MRRLLVLRHAKSSWDDPRLPDRERPLARRGREAAPLVAARMAELELAPCLVLCSTALRARQTWLLVQPALGGDPEVRYEDRLYDADAETILEVVRELPSEASEVLLVGHNPGLEELTDGLIAAGPPDACAALRSKFPTAAFAVVELSIDDWSEVKRRSGRLEHFVTPRMIEEQDRAA